MKCLHNVGISQILAVIVLLSAANGQLIYWREYIDKIAQRLVGHIETKQITGSGMPMATFENPINKTLYGLLVQGTVRFHSGFIARIDSVNLKSTSYQSSNGEIQSTVSAQLAFNGMQIVYDVEYDLVGYKETGTFLLWIPETLFDIFVRKDHQSQVVSGSLSFLTTGSQNSFIAEVHPNNGYTQLTAREMKQFIAFRQNMTDSFSVWNEEWQTILQSAISETEFPDICYYCP